MGVKSGTIVVNTDVEAADIATLFAMSDAEYRDYLQDHGLMFVDHHDVLRSSPAAYPLATTVEQLDILIDELKQVRDRMMLRDAS